MIILEKRSRSVTQNLVQDTLPSQDANKHQVWDS